MTMDPARAIELAAMSRQEPMNEALKLGDSEIQKFYKNSVVFMTGGSGFIGKQLTEKLFRPCHVSKVFWLIRSKKGKNIRERLESILIDPIFDALKSQQPDFTSKIVAVEGDVAKIKLGLKETDWKNLTDEVNVIFHVAATIKFDEAIKVATLINVRGTREILTLGKGCKNLRAHVHVSTAYSHATANRINDSVEEEFYKTPIEPETILAMVETMEEDRFVSVTSGMLKDWPNTYTFTKEVAEELVRTESAGLPICIVRPAIERLMSKYIDDTNKYMTHINLAKRIISVICTNNEPIPGWLDMSCVFSATGLILGFGIGVLHTGFFNDDLKIGLVPCDYVNNAIIAAGKETATNQTKGGNDMRIYTISSTERNPIKILDIMAFVQQEGAKIPTPKAVYYAYFGQPTSNKLLFMIMSLFLHLIPAYLADFVCLLLGKQRRFIKMAKYLYNMYATMSFFLTNEWQLKDDNLHRLYTDLSEQDKAIFNFDVANFNWTQQIYAWFIGTRKYIIKDGLKDTEYAIRKQKVLRLVHYVFMTLYMYAIWKILCIVLYVIRSLFSIQYFI